MGNAVGNESSEAAIASFDTLSKIVAQLELCGYEDKHGHPIGCNVAFISLKRMAANEGTIPIDEEETLP